MLYRLDYIPDRPIAYFRGIYRDISPVFQVTSKAVSESFEAWAQTLMDEKIDSERTWEFGHLNIILDWILERSQDPEWITTRSVSLYFCILFIKDIAMYSIPS